MKRYFPGVNTATPTVWYHLIDYYAVTPNGQLKNIATPTNFIPAYQRSGTVLPLQLRPRRASPMMEHDAFTLRIALTDITDSKDASKTSASGVLYLDDGDTYDFRDAKAFSVIKYTATIDATIDGSGVSIKIESIVDDANYGATIGAYKSYATVEKIVVMGPDSIMSKIIAKSSQGSAQKIISDSSGQYHAATTYVVIKNPGVTAQSNWVLTLN